MKRRRIKINPVKINEVIAEQLQSEINGDQQVHRSDQKHHADGRDNRSSENVGPQRNVPSNS